MQSQGTADRAPLIHTPPAGAPGTGYTQLASLGPAFGGEECISLILGKQIPSVHLVEIGQWHMGSTGDDVALISYQLSRGQGQASSAPAALLKPEESKGNSDSYCRII